MILLWEWMPMVMSLYDLQRDYPNIEPAALFAQFPRVDVAGYPEFQDYSWEDIHAGTMGAGALFLASDMARLLELKSGMCVLDLGPGKAASSIFLAKHCGVHVVAADLWIDPTDNWTRVREAGMAEAVLPIRMEAHQIPFPEGFFDAVFCMNAYFYFGTDDLYLAYLARFLRPGGRIVIGSPCFRRELNPIPTALCGEDSHAWHSPEWWRNHFERSGQVKVLHCAEHPHGHAFWLDDLRFLLESQHPRERDAGMQAMILEDLTMLLSDTEKLVTVLMLLAEKR